MVCGYTCLHMVFCTVTRHWWSDVSWSTMQPCDWVSQGDGDCGAS